MDLIQQVGAFAGLAAFLGLAVLAMLYFSQARDVRRLRENASFLVEADTPGATQARPGARRSVGDAPAGKAAVAPAGSDVEAFRRAELARQAEERRRRFEQRHTGGRGRGVSIPEIPGGALGMGGAAILLIGIVFGLATVFGGGGSSPEATKQAPSAPAKVTVAVLNSTPQSGLAADFARIVKQKGYELGAITNTDTPFTSSTVMFDKGGEQAAAKVARDLGISEIIPLSPEVRAVSDKALVAVVVGEDKADGP